MIEFLRAVWGDFAPYGELRMIRKGEVKSFFFEWPKEQLLVEEYAQNLDEEGYDVFYGVVPREVRRGADEDVVPLTYVLWQDIDIKSTGGTHFHALGRLLSGGIPPSILVDSGHGFHAYHLLSEPTRIERAVAVMKGMAAEIGGDHTWNASRVLRLPGTHNHKSDPSLPVRLLYIDTARRYSISDFDMFIRPERVIRRERGSGLIWELSSPDAPKFGEGERNNGLTRLGGAMIAKGIVDYDELLIALEEENLVRCVPPLPDSEVRNIARSVARYAA